MQYEVRALRGNEIATLLVDAISEADALHRAAASAVRPLSARPVARSLRGGQGSAGRFSVLFFCQEMLALLEAGLTPYEAVAALIEQEGAADARGILTVVAGSMSEGKSLSAALQAAGTVFPPLFVGLVRSAEQTGNLIDAMGRYIEYRTRLDTVRSRLASSMIYPALLAVVGTLVTLFLVAYVVPRFAGVYQGSGRSLPWMSALLIQWGEFVAANAFVLMAATLAGLLAAVLAWRRHFRGRGMAGLLRHLPGFAERVDLYEISRLYMTVGMLLQGGMPMLVAMEMASEVLSPGMRQRTQRAMRAIADGGSASRSLEEADLATPVGLRMLRVGEKSGSLGEMMIRTARFHDAQIERWVDWFVRLFEPVLMTGIGLVVGLVVVLLYIPIFDLAGSLQ